MQSDGIRDSTGNTKRANFKCCQLDSIETTELKVGFQAAVSRHASQRYKLLEMGEV